MNKAIKLSEELVSDANRYANVFSRSVPKQIEHWARIGRIVEENPDLSYEDVKNLLFALKEKETGDVTEYKFG